MKLSNQAMGALMMTLQKCLMEETDIIGLLQEMDLQIDGDEIIILNPPVISLEGVAFNNVSELADYALQETQEESTEETV